MRRRLVLVAVVLTALVLALDATGLTSLGPLRAGAATALGPLERLVAPRADPAAQERLRGSVQAAVAGPAADDRLAGLLAAPGVDGTPVVLARVVGVGPSGPAGPERVTIDAGSRDGVEVDRTVVSADGLVGRVVAVAPWTSDVLLVGAPELSVGVRVGARGVLGEASGTAAPGAAAPAPGTLSLALVERGTMRDGDPVVTLGSIDGRPFVPGVRVGTVREVERPAGRLAATGVVVPAVDVTALDLVAVVVPAPRRTPRPVVTPSPRRAAG
ncbi:rod shape-determining protein MreC [Phycicoccus flavus]|uniref:rod shape-determining protein MreC n=1 Tax=Phycicoccus flavus TaxID=2502783 RepID=UPI000FEB6AC3|nr:rod shape-determining protein MreC [Phycicoccus flavus]NHA67328.1 rod shape-determining protein MreC [Phycicoccus flavus]